MVQRGAEQIEKGILFDVYPPRAPQPSRLVRRRHRSRVRRVILLCILLAALVAALMTPFGSDGARAATTGAAMGQLAGR